MSAQLHSLCQEVDHDYNVALAKEAKEMSESKLQQPEKQARAPPLLLLHLFPSLPVRARTLKHPDVEC